MELPFLAVGVEDAIAEKVAEGLVKGEAFMVTGEVSFENVLDHRGVRREYLTGAKGTVEDERGGGNAVENIGDPVHAPVRVGCNRKHGTDYRISFGDIGGSRIGCF